ncbi:helix-hairpin-helix domain-containing protein [Microbacterium sp.]|uniref:helix-hairpin-helix domain-containing protein n=1 Tax=Microbacterium sp. TaxID=51671 RepID=UPI0039E3EEF4
MASNRRRIGVGAAIVLVVAAAAITVIIGIVRAPAAQTVPLGVDTTASAQPAALFVHVSGAVAAPGLYRLAQGARVVDVVTAAGGFTDGAAQDAVNLARPLTDGEQVFVPLVGEAAPPEAAGQADGRVNLNTADEAALDTLPRIGPALAARIIDWRESNGRFTSADDLLAVPGIGEKMLESLRDLVTV